MVFHLSLSDSKSPRVFKTILSILADLNNAVVWMDSTRPLTSKSSSSFNNPSMTLPRAPITIGLNITFTFHSLFRFPSKVKEFILLFAFFQFYSLVSPRFCKFSFLLIIIRSGRLAEIRWFVCISKSHWSLCVSFSRTDSGLCIYHLFVWSNSHSLHNSQ